MIKKAFTLAEVLITLGIIGVVAAMTIPALIINTQENELKTAWKKEYSVISQAFISIVSENGGTIKDICVSEDSTCFLNLLATKLKTIKICPDPTAKGNCWHNDNSAKNYGGGADWSTSAGNVTYANSAMILNDGAFILPAWYKSDCTNDAPLLQDCGWIIVDVNGFKKPNVQGKDIFSMYILENRLIPEGTPGDWIYTNLSQHGCDASVSASTASGLGCSAKYLQQ